MDVLRQEGLHVAMRFKRLVPLISKWLIIFTKKNGTMLIFNLHSCTFDVSVLTITKVSFEVKAIKEEDHNA